MAPEPNPTQSKRYRYEATITLIIAADGQDEAYRIQKSALNAVDSALLARGVVRAHSSILDLKHRPDLDGSLRG
jgi:hypothetical protein